MAQPSNILARDTDFFLNWLGQIWRLRGGFQRKLAFPICAVRSA